MKKQPSNGHNGNAPSPSAAIIEKAQATGERQLLRLSREPCDDPASKFSVDYVGTWVMPDGTLVTTRDPGD